LYFAFSQCRFLPGPPLTMKFTLLALVTAAAAVALPDRRQVRDDSVPISGPVQYVHWGSNRPLTEGAGFNQQSDEFDLDTVNWAGAVYTSPPANTNFTYVAGRFTVPTPLLPSPWIPNTKYTAAVWVGLDGLTAQSAILQAGVEVSVTLNITSFEIIYEYRAWTEWWPASPVFFSSTQFAISPGDIVSISINATSPTSGIATLSNANKQINISHNVSAPSASATLKGQNAEWIVEDPRNSATTEDPFVDFAPVSFDSCIAGTADGRYVDASQAETVEIYSLSLAKTITSVATPGEGLVTVTKTLL